LGLRDQRREVAGLLQFLGAGEQVFRAGEEAVQGVIVARADRVVLVIVAARAPQRQPSTTRPVVFRLSARAHRPIAISSAAAIAASRGKACMSASVATES